MWDLHGCLVHIVIVVQEVASVWRLVFEASVVIWVRIGIDGWLCGASRRMVNICVITHACVWLLVRCVSFLGTVASHLHHGRCMMLGIQVRQGERAIVVVKSGSD